MNCPNCGRTNYHGSPSCHCTWEDIRAAMERTRQWEKRQRDVERDNRMRRKLAAGLLALAVLVAGCSPRGAVVDKAPYDSTTTGTVTCEGHRYRWFAAGRGQTKTMSYVHDPDCPCRAAEAE